ncbi:hypothetical protein GALL_298200 [mine drainage metagenome]|uniref:RecA family profile 1 domain-containing protein n=1 Tax=mine drainage metagenome TaxID=410659 RepID=A0A1J5QXH8_9ZZZZ
MILPDLADLVVQRGAAHGLSLHARHPALAQLQGAHRSAQRGRGLEFEEVRPYVAGDDARSIDWRVTARRGKVHTKLFCEERERAVWIVADLHPGLFFGSRQQLKSTLLLQVLAELAAREAVLYVSGEESAAQIGLRAQRLGLRESPLRLLAETQLERITDALQTEAPRLCVIDSIQTVFTEAIGSAPGSVAQVRECAARLTRHAKTAGTGIVMVGHVTKEGALAGPRVLEHMVDTVLYFEGDSHSSYRLIRAIKNRYGAVNELGVFAMTERGLRGVANPSAIFLSQHGAPVAGSCVLATLEGTRPLLVEIQALADHAAAPSPRRLSVGLDPARLAMLLAVLHRHAGIACGDQDVFVNAVGGVRIGEPAADLAVLLAIHSSLKNRALARGLFVFGEVGLAGEIRPAPRGQERLREAAKLGFSTAIIPAANAPRSGGVDGLRLYPVQRIEQALDVLRELQDQPGTTPAAVRGAAR